MQQKIQPRKQPRQKRARETVAAIIEATAIVLKREGYEKTNTNIIAEIAGVSIGTLYQYFPNKESLFMALVEDHSNRMLSKLQETAIQMADAPISDTVRHYVKVMIQAHSIDPVLHSALIAQVFHLGKPILQKAKAHSIMIVRAYLETRRDEIVAKDLDIATYIIVTMVESVVHLAAIERPEFFQTDAFVDEMCGNIMRYLVGSS